MGTSPLGELQAMVKNSQDVIIYLMCQLDQAMMGPDLWSNINLGVSVRMYLDEANICIGRFNKADCPP